MTFLNVKRLNREDRGMKTVSPVPLQQKIFIRCITILKELKARKAGWLAAAEESRRKTALSVDNAKRFARSTFRFETNWNG